MTLLNEHDNPTHNTNIRKIYKFTFKIISQNNSNNLNKSRDSIDLNTNRSETTLKKMPAFTAIFFTKPSC